MDLYEFLDRNRIRYERFDHPPVFTCEQAKERIHGVPGTGTKNLFLRERTGRRHFLLVTSDRKAVDLRRLGGLLGVKKLTLASVDRLRRHLNLEPGSVTLLGLIHDEARGVELLFDRELEGCDALQCHPLVNTATLVIPREDALRFCERTGHEVRFIDVPGRIEAPGPASDHPA
jgi:Ala-tRNA(Pro) deacylase